MFVHLYDKDFSLLNSKKIISKKLLFLNKKVRFLSVSDKKILKPNSRNELSVSNLGLLHILHIVCGIYFTEMSCFSKKM